MFLVSGYKHFFFILNISTKVEYIRQVIKIYFEQGWAFHNIAGSTSLDANIFTLLTVTSVYNIMKHKYV